MTCPLCRQEVTHLSDGRCVECDRAFRQAKRKRTARKRAAMTAEEERAWAIRELNAGRAWVRRP